MVALKINSTMSVLTHTCAQEALHASSHDVILRPTVKNHGSKTVCIGNVMC